MREFVNMLVRKLKLRGNSAARFETRYVPAAAVLVLTTFAPSVAATAPQVVTPPTKSLTITRYAPVVTSGSFSLIVTPGTKALVITRYAPTVTVPTPQLVTPTTRALVITRYAPTAALSNALVVTPTTRALALIPRVPTITASNKQRVTPTTKALVITRFVPIISSPGSGPKLVVPPTKALVATRFAPTVTATADRLLIPGKATRTITRYAPTVSLGNVAGFYISPTGSDTTGTGTIGNPWRTIQKFINQSSAGDTLYVRGGTHSTAQADVSTAGHSGTAADPITIRNYPGETPVFTNIAFYLEGGSSYWVLDGITIDGPVVGSSSHIWIGNGRAAPAATDTHHITVRNCVVTKTGGAVTAHGIYLSWKCRDLTVEYCTITGTGTSFTPGVDNARSGIHIFHDPMPTNVLIQRNFIRNWPKGIITYSDLGTAGTATGSILHNTFQNNDYHIDLRHHQAFTVRDNVGGTHVTDDFYDPLTPGRTTADHNYWSQTLTVAGKLTAGSPAINGAHDGTDAGAFDYP